MCRLAVEFGPLLRQPQGGPTGIGWVAERQDETNCAIVTGNLSLRVQDLTMVTLGAGGTR